MLVTGTKHLNGNRSGILFLTMWLVGSSIDCGLWLAIGLMVLSAVIVVELIGSRIAGMLLSVGVVLGSAMVVTCGQNASCRELGA